jgi:uncharacterized membrane-anchored protein
MRQLISFLLAVGLCVGVAHADGDDDAALKAFIDGLTYQSGTIALSQANATLKLAPEYRFLGAQDAQNVLENLWGNPEDSDVIGLLLPAGKKSLTDDRSWAVVLTYSGDGYVSDEEASKTDYAELLKDLQEATKEENEARKQQGYEAVELVGWATEPRYDATTAKLYWAKELDFAGTSEHTLNYDIRVLGRSGYLSMNAIAPISELATVERGMQKVLEMTEFNAGARYADFNQSTDKVAAYGIAALVGGALATKAGLFAKLAIVLAKFWKLAIVGLAGLAAIGKKMFSRS